MSLNRRVLASGALLAYYQIFRGPIIRCVRIFYFGNVMEIIMEKSLPPITVSSLDLERIEDLLEMASFRKLPGVEALQGELKRASVVDPEEVPPDLVTMNSTVVVLDEDLNSQSELTLVYPNSVQQANPVSVLAPVGSALLGLSVGQSIAWPLPSGRELHLRVLSVKSQPEASGLYYR